MNARVDFKYDSHVHFFGTGIPSVEWDMKKFPIDRPHHLKEKTFLRGFGWKNESQFYDCVQSNPTIQFFLSKIDGHSAFISTNLVERLNLEKDDLLPLKDIGYIVSENQKDFIERLLPKRSDQDLEKMALYSQNLFLNSGINKVRHLTCTEHHWRILEKLEKANKLKLEIECFFSEFMDQDFEEAINAFTNTSETELLKPRGLKVFYDGSFGSKTAYSELFKDAETRLSFDQLKNRIEVAFELECDIAIHTIGEKAVDESIKAFKEVMKTYSSNKTTLQLEHCPAFSTSVLNEMKSIPINLHFQPSHYPGDKEYLEELREKGLLIYPFKILKENNIIYNFGSDSPVSEPMNKEQLEKFLEMIPENKIS